MTLAGMRARDCRPVDQEGKPAGDYGICIMSAQTTAQWTTDFPAVAGWYWWRPGPTTAKVFRKRLPAGIYRLELCGFEGHETLHLALPKDRNRYPAEWMGGEWAGPIPEPEGGL